MIKNLFKEEKQWSHLQLLSYLYRFLANAESLQSLHKS